jgi:hypothetical protein
MTLLRLISLGMTDDQIAAAADAMRAGGVVSTGLNSRFNLLSCHAAAALEGENL